MSDSTGTRLKTRTGNWPALDTRPRYQNPGEVLDQAFEIIREQLDPEDWMSERRESIAAYIGTGFSRAEGGELIDGDTAVEMLRERRAARQKPQRMRFAKTEILSSEYGRQKRGRRDKRDQSTCSASVECASS